MQWLDTGQSNFDKSYVKGEARDARRGGCTWLSGKRGRKKEGGAEGNAPSSGDERT
jgi:hypothetical protein